jgi:hypothetical protein
MNFLCYHKFYTTSSNKDAYIEAPATIMPATIKLCVNKLKQNHCKYGKKNKLRKNLLKRMPDSEMLEVHQNSLLFNPGHMQANVSVTTS